MSAAKADPVIATAASIPNANFFMLIPQSPKLLAIVVEESGRQCCGVAVTVTRKESGCRFPEPWQLPTVRSRPKVTVRRSQVSDFGDNKSRLIFLQTAEFAASFDPH
jgi:hypothetical protein